MTGQAPSYDTLALHDALWARPAAECTGFAAPGSDDRWHQGAAWIVEKLCTPRTSRPARRG
ncbi:hypothetical protein GCM10010394_29010 [Streptomyces crystallinus]|uniref:Uncharacterized protein n=1 Tax=Streptomyces crystallinus TaxID=68191 RepID=A0ABP3QWX7_9ACTN